jgi:flagellin-like hook-associated protein FlgL
MLSYGELDARVKPVHQAVGTGCTLMSAAGSDTAVSVLEACRDTKDLRLTLLKPAKEEDEPDTKHIALPGLAVDSDARVLAVSGTNTAVFLPTPRPTVVVYDETGTKVSETPLRPGVTLTGAAPAAGPYLRAFVPGGAISLSTQAPPDTNPTAFDYGATVTITGAPASGDSFNVAPSANQDLFQTLNNLVTTLRTGASASAASVADYQAGINDALSNIDNALDNVLTVRTSVGARLKEVDNAQSSSEDLALQYSTTLAGLQDLDYAKAISDLSQQQVMLEAAQQSFLRITKLSLFDML